VACSTLSLALAFSILAIDAPAARAQAALLPPSVEIRTPKAPTVATGESSRYLVYELHVTNLGADTLTLERIDVLSDAGAAPIASLSDSALTVALTRPGVRVQPNDRARIGGGLRAVAFMWVPLSGAPPRSLRHTLTFRRNGTDTTSTAVDAPLVTVSPDAPVIGPPLRGSVWMAANGPSPNVGHRRAMIVVESAPHIAQRFAIDYLKIDEQGRTHQGDSLKNASYYAYGSDAIAVGDGVVRALKDGIPENIPGSRAVPITLETVGGNHVIIDLGGGHYAFYAHLQPGSIRVKLGERVKRGQMLGLVGNSGNSTEPHLHFHISDAPSPLGSEGIPYVQQNAELLGACKRLIAECTRSSPTSLGQSMPLANQLLRFP
jgi:murein DD-endopeptidase MepM/ murein hydrolase activator NlpD